MIHNKVISKVKANIYLLYTITFIVFLLIGLLPIEIKNQSFLFSGLFSDKEGRIDGLKQHSLFIYDFVRAIKTAIASGNGLQLFRFNIGLGSDFVLNYSYYSLFDPLTIIAYIIPLKYIETTYYILIYLRMYLAGIFMILLAKKFNIRKVNALLVTAIFYVFNASVLFAAFRHPMFINGPMYIPLIILGAEKVFRNEKPYLLILASFFALISQFYFFMYLAVGFELFAIIRTYIGVEKAKRSEAFKKLIKMNLYYALGALLGGFILTTQLMGVFGSSRVNAKGYFLYNGFDIGVTIFTFLTPAVGPHFTANIGNLFVFIIVMLYVLKYKHKSWLSVYFIVLSILIFSPLFSYLINGVTYINKRWAFLIALPAALIVGTFIEKEIKIENRDFSVVLKFIISMAIIAGIFLLGFGITKLIDILILQIVIWIGLIGLCGFIVQQIIKRKLNLERYQKYLNIRYFSKAVLAYSLFSLIIISCIYLFTLTPNNAFKDYLGDEDLFAAINDDPEFFRVEQKSYAGNITGHSNDGIYYQYRSTGNYNSMSNGYVNQFLEYFDIHNINTTVGYNGFDFRTQALNFHNVKYVIITDVDRAIPPYGFKYLTSVDIPKYDENKNITSIGGNIVYENGEMVYQKANIYINENYLQFGAVYYDYILESELSLRNTLGRENILLDAVIVAEEVPGLAHYRGARDIVGNVVNEFTLDNIEFEDGTYRVGWGGGTISFTINNITDSEVFLEIINLLPEDRYLQFDTIYRTEDTVSTETYFAYGSNMYIDNSHRFVNLGYYESKEQLVVEIELQMGRYTFNDIKYYLNDMSEIDNKISKLNAHIITDFQENNHGFTGSINHERTGMMVFSIPYHDGFTAYIDGVETEIHLVNQGYMGIVVPAGNHKIVMEYTTPGLNIGIIISISALGVLLIIVIVDVIRLFNNSRIESR